MRLNIDGRADSPPFATTGVLRLENWNQEDHELSGPRAFGARTNGSPTIRVIGSTMQRDGYFFFINISTPNQDIVGCHSQNLGFSIK